MLEVKKIDSMNELLKTRKELESACSDEDIFEEIKEKIYIDLIQVNKTIDSIQNTKMSNKDWLELIINILNQRKNGPYKLQIISGTSEQKKIYTFKGFNQIEVEENDKNNNWYAVIISQQNTNIVDLINSYESETFFLRSSTYNKHYQNKLFTTYDAKKGDICIPSYLSEERSIKDLLDYGLERGLTEEETRILNEAVFSIYKNKKNAKKRVLNK